MIKENESQICDMIKENESEVGSDMLMVSDYFKLAT